MIKNKNIKVKFNYTKKILSVYLFNKLILQISIKKSSNTLLSNKVYTLLYICKVLRINGLIQYNFKNKLKFYS